MYHQTNSEVSLHEIPQMRSGLSDVLATDGGGVPSFASFPRLSGSDLTGDPMATLMEGGHSARQSSWQQAASLVVANVVGTGVLSLAGNFAKLGWGWGLAAMAVCYPL
eukprot:CAMPEP_0204341764 /NCGR_PEP_ID=MMETSP0469-20131031/23605_1 /ASSEMBLY_ACC=CAM_ASM_000384 /TAXON_ID=2969 /ORGANISM="Oxyrrhis marina" /LENGTH=107 /DNA_ID=CAMNT_0051326541 /DNA_START=12 /DNA_END=332 /DNA_ORIENTATION=-